MVASISAEESAKAFFEEYKTNKNVRRSYLREWWMEGHSDATEWTNVMGIFLADLAERCGFVQEWEVDHVDSVWGKKGSKKLFVLIDHENNWKTVDTERDNLAGLDCPLKVVITYPPESKIKKAFFESELERKFSNPKRCKILLKNVKECLVNNTRNLRYFVAITQVTAPSFGGFSFLARTTSNLRPSK